jgi:tungstate transport system permease protein
MDLVWNGIRQAALLLVTGDPEVLGVTWLSLRVSGAATLISLVIGVPIGTVLALSRFPGRSAALAIVNTGMGMPPVVVGLFVTLMLWRTGPLGLLGLLYTPAAMVAAQVVIAAPMVTGLTVAAMQSLDPRVRHQLLGLGASRPQLLWSLWKEARLPLLAAVMAGFGAVVSEVGAVMMVGGNIRGQTRVLTTATVMETSRGNFELAIALGVILLLLAYLVNLGLTLIQQRGKQR